MPTMPSLHFSLFSLGIGFSRFLSTILQICSFMCPSDWHQPGRLNTKASFIKSFEAVIGDIQRSLENYGQNIIKKERCNIIVTVQPEGMNKCCFSARHWRTIGTSGSHYTKCGYPLARVPRSPKRDSEQMGGARFEHLTFWKKLVSSTSWCVKAQHSSVVIWCDSQENRKVLFCQIEPHPM